MNKKGFAIVVGLFVAAMGTFFFLNCQKAWADGMLLPIMDRTILETEQRAIIFFDEGKEDLIVATSFSGNAEEFAWIIPTPSKPEISKSTQLVFERLNEITQPQTWEPLVQSRPDLLEKSARDDGVKIVEQKNVDYYDISVLEASDKDALYNWLNDNGYLFPLGGRNIVDEYIKKGWFFTAIKINNQMILGSVREQLSTGNIVPLKLSFNTDKIVYPLKISQITGSEDESSQDSPFFVYGRNERALRLSRYQMVATDRMLKGLSTEQGSVNFSLKKRTFGGVGDILEIQIPGEGTSFYRKIEISNYTENVFAFRIYSDFKMYAYHVDLGNDFKKNQWQDYSFSWQRNFESDGYLINFSIDGIPRTVNSAAFGKFSNMSSVPLFRDDSAQVVVGGRDGSDLYRELANQSTESLETNKARTITSSYLAGRLGELLIDELSVSNGNSKIFEANFNGNLSFSLGKEVNGQDEGLLRFRLFKTTVPPPTLPFVPAYQSDQSILIYVFADGEYYYPGFENQFGAWMSKEEIENLAKIEGVDPWIKPQKDSYYLTRLWKIMPTAQMNEDLYLEKITDQEGFSSNVTGVSKITFFVLIGVSSFLILLILVLFIKMEKSKKDQE